MPYESEAIAWTFATKARHLSGPKLSAPPSGFPESRTAILPLRVRATSAQFDSDSGAELKTNSRMNPVALDSSSA